jgi:hypothetical protein
MVLINKRNYFRVELVLPVQWRVLDSYETGLVKNGSGCNLISQNLFQVETQKDLIATKDDNVVHAIQTLNSKLNFIINSMIVSDHRPSYDRIVEISASGLKFRTKNNPGEGAFIKMSLTYSGYPHLQLDVITEVMRIQKFDDDYLIAANILCIDENARDFLIKMIFEKQRIDIRRKKMCKENYSDDTTVK